MFTLQQCATCSTKVIAKSDGSCPSCQARDVSRVDLDMLESTEQTNRTVADNHLLFSFLVGSPVSILVIAIVAMNWNGDHWRNNKKQIKLVALALSPFLITAAGMQ